MGPLKGIRIVELAGIGPGPHCSMMLADMGAEVIRIDRPGPSTRGEAKYDPTLRSRRSIALDLKKPEAVETALRLIDQADALVEGFRPGVMERLGLGPEVCLARNPRLVFGRMTGWGQEGPLAQTAGHDINYIALTGVLGSVGQADQRPLPPLNMVGDFGGGALYMVVGILAGLLEARVSGKGQVVDCAMVDGASNLMASIYGRFASGFWVDRREANLSDGGAYFYTTYETKDGKYVSIGSIEPQFYALLLKHTGVEPVGLPAQFDREKWPEMTQKFAAIFKTKTRDEWTKIMEGTDICFAPVLSLAEAPHHPANKARNVFVEVDGVLQPAPAPRFERTPAEISASSCSPGEHSEAILSDWGFGAGEIESLRRAGAVT